MEHWKVTRADGSTEVVEAETINTYEEGKILRLIGENNKTNAIICFEPGLTVTRVQV